MSDLATYLTNTMFINNLILLMFFVGFIFLFLKESYNDKSQINWADAFIDKKTGRVSLSQLGQFCGIAVGTWMMIFLVQIKEAYSILPMMFPMYLAYLGGAYAFSKYMSKSDNSLKLNIDDKDKDGNPNG